MHVKQRENLYQATGFQIVDKVEYLGITITNKCSSLFEDNYKVLGKN